MNLRPTARLCLLVPALLASAAHAQWTYTDLHPAGMTWPFAYSQAHACDATEIVGHFEGDQLPGEPSIALRQRGCVWNYNATVIKTFPMQNPGISGLKSLWNGQYTGYRRPDAGGDPAENGVFWNAEGEWALLTDENCFYSAAHAIYGNQQVGFNCGTYACIWYGTRESRVDLHVPGWTGSVANGVWDGQQAGAVGYPVDNPSNVTHAGVWYGTRESWFDLHPTHLPEVYATVAQCTSREQQAGYWLTREFGGERACVWSGTPESWTDLMPPNAINGQVWAISGGWQVGYVLMNGDVLASLWHGSSQSWVNLHQFLPPDTVDSEAKGVWTDGRTLRVVGTRNAPGISFGGRAFLLTRTLPCATDLDNDGSLANGGTPDNAVDVNDLLFFLAAFEAGAPAADLDNNGDPAATIPDGAVDINDLLFFLVRFEAGC